MAITFPSTTSDIQSATLTTGTAYVVAKPANVANSDLLVAICYHQVVSSTFTAPAGWTEWYHTIFASTRGFYIYTKPIPSAAGESSTTYTFTASSSGRGGCIVFRAVGTDPTTPLDAAPTADDLKANSATITAPAITAVSSSAMLLALSFANGSGGVVYTATAPGFTPLANINVNNAGSTSTVNVAYKQLAASGTTGTVVTTWSTTPPSSGGFILSLDPAAVGITGNASNNSTFAATTAGVVSSPAKTGGVTKAFTAAFTATGTVAAGSGIASSRILTEDNGVYFPASLMADTTSARSIIGSINPSSLGALAVGDKWYSSVLAASGYGIAPYGQDPYGS